MGAYAKLLEACRQKAGIVVGFSGGVDSALVARLAHDALGDRALAVIVDSESYAPEERDAAVALAQRMGIPYELVWHSELADPNYAANPTNRCYFCRQGLSDVLFDVAARRGFATVAVGTNTDDANDKFRPGDMALRERGAWQPFVEHGLAKVDVRALSEELGVPVSQKPSMACLSSRIPYGEPVTMEKLTRIGRAETWLRAQGFAQMRVRTHGGDIARVEVLPEEVRRAVALAPEMTRAFAALGYARVEIDPRGYRTGAMNETIR